MTYNFSLEEDKERIRDAAPKSASPKDEPGDPFSEELRRRYYIIEEDNTRSVYADSQKKKELFSDTGQNLRAKDPDKTTIRLMLDTAAHRGWQSVILKGNKDFMREAWIEANLRGLETKGYEPTQIDKQDLEKRAQSLGISIKKEHEKISEPSLAKGQMQNHTTTEKVVRPNYKEGISGEVIDIGSRPYRDDPKNENCPYVDLRLHDGQTHRVWGVGLPDALNDVKMGDEITLKENGKELVDKTITSTSDKGEVETRTIQVERRAWLATIHHERDQNYDFDEYDFDGEYADDFALDNAEIDRISNQAFGAAGSLHSGPGRDIAFTGMSANEDRARDFETYGSNAASTSPELAGAVATERYIENKLREAFPNKPARVERGVQVARQKISNMIRHGVDFPKGQKIKDTSKELELPNNKEREKDFDMAGLAPPREDRER